MTTAAIKAEASRISAVFEAAGAVPVEAEIMQPAEVLLDLYGEDIRGRAYVTDDPVQGEMMLRPDFTVPVVQMHMQSHASPARYTYSGPVFRKQDEDPSRAREYTQVGFEVFDGQNPAAADADVFATVQTALADAPVRAATGDIGLLKAAVAGLQTSDARKAALMRHIWRPKRFKILLDRFGGRVAVPAKRLALLANENPFADAGPEVGLRSRQEVQQRLDTLRADAAMAPISGEEIAVIEAILALSETAPHVLSALHDIAVDMPAIRRAVGRFEARLDAMSARGVDVETLPFEGSYGRTSLEYYDGFVFGFYGLKDNRPVATGGRYDALTEVLGEGRAAPAVGAVIRPDLLLEVRAC
ncbi:ATP phosphoribosyltransferase regulatory subunit [Loktanella ponticola]|uniref:Histidine--tRNA ligase n=1 Tax=Yoonia ponticola TaxID=1524255 RepID=A0A7W9EWE4_9RHOB|nr:ATP phosphoribosyltransferase regulatory subunit [Yoonia ponticola]